jgi:signal transduction histidine kinase
MFQSARIRLTFWYVTIIALISLSFSAIVYRYVSWELTRGFTLAEYRLRGQPVPPQKVRIILEDELAEAKKIVLFRLFTINGVILLASGMASYFLAGITLMPIEETLEDQKRFVSDASHELRTSLTSLKTEIEVGLRNKKLKAKDAKDLLKSNLEEVDKMQKLSNYLLNLSRYQSDGSGVEFELINLKEIVENVIEKMEPVAKEKNKKIVKDLEDVKIKGNDVSLIELTTILLDNALKYSGEGKKVVVKLGSSKKNAILEIQDFGIGIRKTEIPHIFDRFFRADSSRNKETIDGFGLGLSIAKKIAEIHRGEIKVTSTVGKGSTFNVFLPKKF